MPEAGPCAGASAPAMHSLRLRRGPTESVGEFTESLPALDSESGVANGRPGVAAASPTRILAGAGGLLATVLAEWHGNLPSAISVPLFRCYLNSTPHHNADLYRYWDGEAEFGPK